MPQNNPALFTAVIAGATGGSINDRWITRASPSDYQGLVNAVVAIATAVDASIPGINSGPSLITNTPFAIYCSRVLLIGILLMLLAADYTAIANAITALFNQSSVSTAPVPTILAMGHIHDDGSGPVIIT